MPTFRVGIRPVSAWHSVLGPRVFDGSCVLPNPTRRGLDPMPRQLIMALGLAAALLAAGSPARPVAAAEEPGHAAAHAVADEGATAGHGAAHEPNILEPQPSLAIRNVGVFIGP